MVSRPDPQPPPHFAAAVAILCAGEVSFWFRCSWGPPCAQSLHLATAPWWGRLRLDGCRFVLPLCTGDWFWRPARLRYDAPSFLYLGPAGVLPSGGFAGAPGRWGAVGSAFGIRGGADGRPWIPRAAHGPGPPRHPVCLPDGAGGVAHENGFVIATNSLGSGAAASGDSVARPP